MCQWCARGCVNDVLEGGQWSVECKVCDIVSVVTSINDIVGAVGGGVVAYLQVC